ncbi:hypothetical protein [Streptomyces sp. 840.1]|uniref:hypothetical protein n=1 Tax=Streptomyces sp. 840.1 TaxID=2485152 RepID=UPI00160C2429|nr:hypothetical protein [Streptomyces sp. 840.1]
MALTATELLLQPSTSRWAAARIATWTLTGALLIAWALLRTAQKQRLHQIAQSDDTGTPSPESGPTYDRAA